MGYVLALAKEREEEELRHIAGIPTDTPIITLSSIREAKRVAGSIIPDTILIDPRLPNGVGMEFLTFLEGYPELASVPFVVLSNHALDHKMVSGQSQRAETFVPTFGARSLLPQT